MHLFILLWSSALNNNGTTCCVPFLQHDEPFKCNGATCSTLHFPRTQGHHHYYSTNALTFQSLIDEECLVSGRSICVRTHKFPSGDLGLPEGIINIASATTVDVAGKVHYGIINLLQKPLEQLICQLNPNCILSDMLFTWTVDLAEELNIPRDSFQPTKFFLLLHQALSDALHTS